MAKWLFTSSELIRGEGKSVYRTWSGESGHKSQLQWVFIDMDGDGVTGWSWTFPRYLMEETRTREWIMFLLEKNYLKKIY